jgi:small membrane protein
MTLIQVILTAGIVFIGLYMYLRIRSSLTDVLLILVFMGGGVLLVLFPDFTTEVAQKVGVGRGVDLIFYLGFLFLLFIVLKLYARVRKLEQHLTKKVRSEAIENTKDLK